MPWCGMGWPISASMRVRRPIFIDFIKLPLLSNISSWTLIWIDKEALWCEPTDAVAIFQWITRFALRPYHLYQASPENYYPGWEPEAVSSFVSVANDCERDVVIGAIWLRMPRRFVRKSVSNASMVASFRFRVTSGNHAL